MIIQYTWHMGIKHKAKNNRRRGGAGIPEIEAAKETAKRKKQAKAARLSAEGPSNRAVCRRQVGKTLIVKIKRLWFFTQDKCNTLQQFFQLFFFIFDTAENSFIIVFQDKMHLYGSAAGCSHTNHQVPGTYLGGGVSFPTGVHCGQGAMHRNSHVVGFVIGNLLEHNVSFVILTHKSPTFHLCLEQNKTKLGFFDGTKGLDFSQVAAGLQLDSGEDEISLMGHVNSMKKEMRRTIVDEAKVKLSMDRTFVTRRAFIDQERRLVNAVLDDYPAPAKEAEV